MKQQIERKFIPVGVAGLKFAGAEDATEMKFSGYGAHFKNVDAYGDVIEPGAFAQYLADAKAGRQPWPMMLENHGGFGLGAQDLTPVGAWEDLSEDGTGLVSAGSLAEIQRGRELYTLMKMKPRPAISGLSIGYIPKEYEPRSKPEDPRRRLKRVDLVEISIVTFPANRLARVQNVKALDDLDSLSEIEDYLRDAGGFSRSEAKQLIARVKGSPREAGDVLAELRSVVDRNTTIAKGQS